MNFKREPAALLGALQALLILVAGFGASGLTSERIGLIVAAVNAVGGLVVAFYTRHATLAVLVAAAQSAVALAIGFGVPWTGDQTAALLAAVAAVGGLFLRTQTSPAVDPGFRDEPMGDLVVVHGATRSPGFDGETFGNGQ